MTGTSPAGGSGSAPKGTPKLARGAKPTTPKSGTLARTASTDANPYQDLGLDEYGARIDATNDQRAKDEHGITYSQRRVKKALEVKNAWQAVSNIKEDAAEEFKKLGKGSIKNYDDLLKSPTARAELEKLGKQMFPNDTAADRESKLRKIYGLTQDFVNGKITRAQYLLEWRKANAAIHLKMFLDNIKRINSPDALKLSSSQ